MSRFFLISSLCVLALLGTLMPLSVFAQRTVPEGEVTRKEAYVPCGDLDVKTVKIVNGQKVETDGPDDIVDNPCQFTHIIEFAKKLIMGWIIFGVIFSTAGFAYAGLLYISAMGSQEKISHAHMIFVKTFWGFVFMLSAWLIAYTMENIFLSKERRCNSFLTTTEDRAELGCPPAP